MTNRVLLNNVDHHDLRVSTRYAAAFGDAVNQALIFPTEFEDAQRDYVILFRKDEAGAFVSVVLLGLDADENLFLGDGGWQARYVPAIQQRGPFSIGLSPTDAEAEPMIHVDLDDPRVGAADGVALFREHGGNAPHLDHVAAVLQAIHVGFHVRAPLAAALDAAGLIRPVDIRLEVEEGLTYDLPDFHAVSRAHLAALDADTLHRLHSRGFLHAAFAACMSLGNIDALLDRKRARLAEAAA